MLMNIKKTLKDINKYILTSRQVGHTESIIRGLENVDSFLFITNSVTEGEMIKKRLPQAKVINVRDIEKEGLKGYNIPIVFGNSSLLEIFYGALGEINKK